MAEQDGFDSRPVEGGAELAHELDAAVLFQATTVPTLMLDDGLSS
jgi:hypothetical protein